MNAEPMTLNPTRLLKALAAAQAAMRFASECAREGLQFEETDAFRAAMATVDAVMGDATRGD